MWRGGRSEGGGRTFWLNYVGYGFVTEDDGRKTQEM